ncbi:CHAT domain-containing protein [Spirosoma fluviale]|uniref:Tetratricopeptide repeat-containing protein n=1 Tax=Spirosoma fluviale TaxID=1597977 RepID=A0A286GSA1_9BACT|nr:CHAT domain-containing tetratricopeptide repeat protein [Spirosoma fluviale]SOD98431.1 Tetratricopeptide repeat-containing protein [Spirosoma fluviale]
MWRTLVLGLVLLPALVRAQCPTMAQRYSRLVDLSGLPTPRQIISKSAELERQSRNCRTTNDSVYAKTLHILGRSYWYAGSLDTAIALTRRAIAVNQMKGPAVRRANLVHSYYNLGRIYGDKADYNRAIQAFTTAIAMARNYPEKWASGASAYDELSYIYYNIGDYEKAVNVAQEGIHLSQKAKDPKMTANTLVQQAQSLIVLDNLPAAIAALQKALRLAKQINEPGITANVYSLLADVANKQQLAGRAIQYYHKAIYLNKQANFRHGCFQSLTSLGLVYARKLRQYDKALASYKQALEYCDDTGGRLVLLNCIGKAQQDLTHYQEALGYYQDAFRLIDPLVDSVSFTSNPDSRSIKLSANKEYLLSLIRDKADTWLDYAKATGNDRKLLKAALDTYKVADQMIDFMRWEHTGQQSKLFWRQKTRSMYERAIETCFLLGDVEQAFRFMEKSRAVMLTDKLNELGARQQLTEVQIAQEQQLRQAVNNQQNTLASLPSDNGPAYNVARMALFAKQDSLTTFLKNLEASNPAYYQYKYENQTIALADLKQYLKKQSGSLVTYFVGDSALYLMAVTSDKAVLKKQPIKAYAKALHQFAELLANPAAMSRRDDVNRFLGLSNDLYRQLLAPFGLPNGRVLVSPDGFFVPFDALSRSPDKADFAVNDYAFSYVYSVGLLLKNGGKQIRGKGFQSTDFLGVAPVEFASGLNQVLLPRSDEALTPIAGRFTTSTLLTHGKATKASFLRKAANARIIHLFTHATADSSDREPSLYFADSTLQLSDLRDGVLPNAELVVLAACKTGIGANQRGEGVFSLARGFSALGVPSVLTTLWSVQNEATYQLTDLFYAYLDQGLPKDVALQRAKQDWLSTAEGEDQLPNYWAGLIIVGDSRPLVHLSYSPWVGILSLLVMIGLGGIWFWRQRERRVMAVFSTAHSA